MISEITEAKLVDAHQSGIAAFNVNGSGIDMAHVIRHARKLYAAENEREAFVAGYIGAKRRAQKAGW